MYKKTLHGFIVS